MGGDKAPDEIVAGAHRAVAELGVDVALVGQPEVLGRSRATSRSSRPPR